MNTSVDAYNVAAAVALAANADTIGARSFIEAPFRRSLLAFATATEGQQPVEDAGCIFFDEVTKRCGSTSQAVEALADESSIGRARVAARLPGRRTSTFETVHRFGEWLALNPNRFHDDRGPDAVLVYLMRLHRQRITLCLAPKEKVPKFDEFAARTVWIWANNATLLPWMARWPNSSAAMYGYYGHVYHAYLWSQPVTSWTNHSANELVNRHRAHGVPALSAAFTCALLLARVLCECVLCFLGASSAFYLRYL